MRQKRYVVPESMLDGEWQKRMYLEVTQSPLPEHIAHYAVADSDDVAGDVYNKHLLEVYLLGRKSMEGL